jgi:sugar phosphate isomerase/epimerase
MKLGLVTYNMAKDWDIPTIIEKCTATGFEGVELRTTHAHGVEVNLSAVERRQVRKRFEDSPVELAGLGSAFEYHATDPAVLRQNIDGTKDYVKLAHDVGAPGVKVRPNAFPDGVSQEKTIEQIGKALRECGQFAKDYGIQIRLEVHGRETCYPVNIRKMIDAAGHDNVFVCWNSNAQDVTDGSVRQSFDLLKDRIALVHINELYTTYPWRELFHLLKGQGYNGYCLAEIPGSPDSERVMHYYRALYKALCM